MESKTVWTAWPWNSLSVIIYIVLACEFGLQFAIILCAITVGPWDPTYVATTFAPCMSIIANEQLLRIVRAFHIRFELAMDILRYHM